MEMEKLVTFLPQGNVRMNVLCPNDWLSVFGALARRAGALARWRVGALARWRVGALARWPFTNNQEHGLQTFTTSLNAILQVWSEAELSPLVRSLY